MGHSSETVYLCEKPSQARDIARVLGAKHKTQHYLSGSEATVTWCFGHLLEMATPDAYGDEYKRWTLETLPIVPSPWRHVVKPDAKAQYRAVEQLIRQARRVVIATDSDREGELLAREILDRVRYRGTIQRLWLSALNDASIRHALDHLRDGDETIGLYHAGMARSRADWLVGMNLTRAYTVMARNQGYDRLLPVGRVQNPALRLVVDRDREIEAFKPTPWWAVTIDVADPETGKTFKASWLPDGADTDNAGRCINASSARQVAQRTNHAIGTVIRAETQREGKASPLPYELGSLQQDAERIAQLDPSTVDAAVQSLYEKHKAISYPRTECPHLPTSMQGEIDAVFEALTASDPRCTAAVRQADTGRRTKVWNDKAVEKESHHAIIPTSSACDLSAMSRVEHLIYTMIRARYLAQFYPDQTLDRTILSIDVDGLAFRAKGRVEIASGWRVLFPSQSAPLDERDSDANELPGLKQGATVQVQDVVVQDKQTQPPARYTEATLIAKMKNASSLVRDERLKRILRDTTGIGTKGTRAAVVKTLLDRGLIAKKHKKLLATEAGQALIDVLPRAITNPETTALWEQALDDVSDGQVSVDDFVSRQVRWVEAALEQLRARGLNLSELPADPNAKACPDCGRPMRQRKSQHGAFWGCTGYPDCTTTQPIDGPRRSAKRRRAH